MYPTPKCMKVCANCSQTRRAQATSHGRGWVCGYRRACCATSMPQMDRFADLSTVIFFSTIKKQSTQPFSARAMYVRTRGVGSFQGERLCCPLLQMALNIRKVPLNTAGRHFGVGHPTIVVNNNIELSILCQEVHKIQNANSKGKCTPINQ